ncbi:aladin-like isoform X1 [Bombyx mandarina]|uniref:Aladin seven-bladed propeller domain-containing protein n=2 Tax=Bombyx TaxID=7090 RepID=A0A8R1WIC4_BOMMO|nr:aladin [Bombyx mori]XP_028040922.1 aladin-like isoform X1 [Bombyx mandarina]
MSIFHSFPNLPGPEETAFCKLNEVYCCGNARYGNISTFSNATKKHPIINVTRDLHHHRTSDENISMYIDVEDNLLKKITSVWYKQGFLEALSVAADPSVNRESPTLAVTASYILKVANILTAFRYFLQPHLKDIGPKIVANYSRTRNWGQVPVKCLAWHPHTTKIAVATVDDNVRVYCSEVTFVSTLKCKAQGHVSSLNWRPLSASELAVGCEQGVIVWTVDPNLMFTKPSSSNAVLLKKNGHSPVTDVSWSPNGDLLISCSGADTSMLVWDTAMETAIPLRRVAGGGNVFARWSFDASKIFTATSSIIFRIWDTKTWTPERWCARGHRVVAACWGPDNILLFAAKGEPMVYALTTTSLLSGSQTTKATPALDVTKVELSSGEPVGGPILDMCWDPTGRYMAMLFEESHLVAVFCTTYIMMQLKIDPCCFVTGVEDEIPCTMAFQQNFNDGACLTIAWSSGRVQHFPIIYSESY